MERIITKNALLAAANADDLRQHLPAGLASHVVEWCGEWDEDIYRITMTLRLRVVVDDTCYVRDTFDALQDICKRLVSNIGAHTPAGVGLDGDIFVRELGPAGDEREAAWRLSRHAEDWLPDLECDDG